MSKRCAICHHKIRVMCFIGTDYCSDNCRKVPIGEPPAPAV